MKKNIFAIFIATAIIAILTLNTFAMNGQGQGQGQWKWQGQWQWQGQHKNKEAKQELHEHNPSDLLVDVPKQDLSEAEKEMLYYGYSEESLAHDMYMYFYELYWIQTFKNIADSEAKHKEAVKFLLDRYNLEVPTWYWELTDEFNALKTQWEKSLKDALEVWVKIEMLDINDISKTIATTDNDDLKIIFTNIWGASFNHLRWFLNALKNNWFETEINYSEFLTEEEVNTKWWTLKVKMAELVTSKWVVLPNQATAEAIALKCANKENTKNQNWKKQGLWNSYWKDLSVEKWTNLQKNKETYKQQIDKKYWNKIRSINSENLLKINAIIDKKTTEIVNDNNISETSKEKVLTLYMALQEYINWIKK